MSTMTVQIRRKDVISLPIELRRRYSLDEGDVFTLVDLGDGSLLLPPGVSRLAHYGDQVTRMMEKEGVTPEEMFEVLAEEREAYYREHYEQS